MQKRFYVSYSRHVKRLNGNDCSTSGRNLACFFALTLTPNVPTGLYIMLALISLFLVIARRIIIPGSTGPIFTIFHLMIGSCK